MSRCDMHELADSITLPSLPPESIYYSNSATKKLIFYVPLMARRGRSSLLKRVLRKPSVSTGPKPTSRPPFRGKLQSAGWSEEAIWAVLGPGSFRLLHPATDSAV